MNSMVHNITCGRKPDARTAIKMSLCARCISSQMVHTKTLK